jgi:hypothetical protein
MAKISKVTSWPCGVGVRLRRIESARSGVANDQGDDSLEGGGRV